MGKSHEEEEEGKGAHKPRAAARKPRAGDGHGAGAWVGSAQRNRTRGPWGCTLVLKLEDIYHPQGQKDARRGARTGFGGQPRSISLAPRSSSGKMKQ